MKKFVERFYYPLHVFTALSLNYYLIQIVNEKYFYFLTMAVSILSIIVVFFMERAFPYRKDWNENKGDYITDILQTNFILPAAVKVVEFTLLFSLVPLSQLVRENLGISRFWPEELPLLIQLILAIMIAEFFFYWIHRATHKNLFLWRFHAVHHSAKRIYWANSGRFNFIDGMLNFSFYLMPFFFLGIPAETYCLFYTATAVTGLLEHSNIKYRAGKLNYVFNTAELHRWHHSIDVNIANHNFGKITCFWDLIFGTFYYRPGEDVQDIGVQGYREVPNSVIGQSIYPFRDINSRS